MLPDEDTAGGRGSVDVRWSGGRGCAVESVGHCNCHSRTMGRFRNGDERAQYLIKRDLRLRNDNTAQCFSAARLERTVGT